MVAYTIHDADGRILCAGDCPQSMLDDQLSGYDGGILLLETSDPRVQYVSNGQVVDKPPRPGPSYAFDPAIGAWVETRSLTDARVQAVNAINKAASAARSQYITVIPGQEMIYLAKEAEAVRYLAETPEPETLDGYTMLAAEVGITAPTAYELAQLWANMSALWRGIAAQIETARLGAIYQIETAPDAAAVDAIVAAAVAALVAN
jgi:hypothetical protein